MWFLTIFKNNYMVSFYIILHWSQYRNYFGFDITSQFLGSKKATSSKILSHFDPKFMIGVLEIFIVLGSKVSVVWRINIISRIPSCFQYVNRFIKVFTIISWSLSLPNTPEDVRNRVWRWALARVSQCGNYEILLTRFCSKNFVKSPFYQRTLL